MTDDRENPPFCPACDLGVNGCTCELDEEIPVAPRVLVRRGDKLVEQTGAPERETR